MKSAKSSLVESIMEARDAELTARNEYLYLASSLDVESSCRIALIRHGERSAVQAAKLERLLNSYIQSGKQSGMFNILQRVKSAVHDRPVSSTPALSATAAIDLVDREVLRYAELREHATRAGDETTAQLCASLQKEELDFRATMEALLD